MKTRTVEPVFLGPEPQLCVLELHDLGQIVQFSMILGNCSLSICKMGIIIFPALRGTIIHKDNLLFIKTWTRGLTHHMIKKTSVLKKQSIELLENKTQHFFLFSSLCASTLVNAFVYFMVFPWVCNRGVCVFKLVSNALNKNEQKGNSCFVFEKICQAHIVQFNGWVF